MTFVTGFVTVVLLSATRCIHSGWIQQRQHRVVPDSLRRRGHSETSMSSLSTLESPSIEQEKQYSPLTTALLKISYDGAHFTGWSSANQDSQHDDVTEQAYSQGSSSLPFQPSCRRRRRQARSPKSGYVRSVQGVFQTLLAKLFGDVDPSRVVVEGCSRTDKGVHSQSMIAQVYCLSSNSTTNYQNSTIPGKKLPHPTSSWDESCRFDPIPMDLPKLMYVLNRMLPHDVKVLGVAPVPVIQGGVFHPSLNADRKTYQYTFSVGEMHDPTQWRTTWHLEYETSFSIEKARRVFRDLLLGSHDFCAFRGAPRGSDDKRRQETEATICTLTRVDIDECIDISTFPGVSSSTYTVTIMGDQFLYKMMRFLLGAIVAVGTDKLSFEDVQLALTTGSWEGEDGRKQFTCAPPHGLILKDVSYNVPLEWSTCSNRVSSC